MTRAPLSHKRFFYSILLTLVTCWCQTILASTLVNQTLSNIKDRGELICGVGDEQSGMSSISKKGEWEGFDIDFCKAIAAAVLSDAESVDFIALSTGARFSALTNREIDVLIRNSSWTFDRDTSMGIEFVGVSLYDGQGFLASKSLGLSSIKEIKPKTTTCVNRHTTTEKNLISFDRLHKLNLSIKIFSSSQQAKAALFMGECQLYTGDMSELSVISHSSLTPSRYTLLPEKISKEILGPVVRDDDSNWINLVRWVLYLTIEAEEKGITSSNINQMLTSKDPSIRYILGVDPGIGSRIGLDDQWARRVLLAVGNYGEIFNRSFSNDGQLIMQRGLNHLWNNGGILYAPPLR